MKIMSTVSFAERKIQNWTHCFYLQKEKGYVLPREKISIKGNKSYEEYIEMFDGVDLVLIYNGYRENIIEATRAAKDLQKKIIFSEVGYLPQKGWIAVDNVGLFCHSSLNDSIDWVTNEHIKTFNEYKNNSIYTKYLSGGESKYILCCLQMEWDAQITTCTSLRNFDVIKWCVENYPNEKIIIRIHPRELNKNKIKEIKKISSELDQHISVVGCNQNIPFLQHCLNSKFVVGLNSTSLIEAMMIGKDVIALADCPIKKHTSNNKKNTEKLLAAYYNSQYKWGDIDSVKHALSRFNIH